MIDGYADPWYAERIGLGKRAEVDGFDVDGRCPPSETFYTGKSGPIQPTHLDDLYKEPTIAELEADQKELHALYKSGEMRSEDYQREWRQLEDQIKAIRQEREQRGRNEESRLSSR